MRECFVKGLIMVGQDLWRQHPRDLLSRTGKPWLLRDVAKTQLEECRLMCLKNLETCDIMYMASSWYSIVMSRRWCLTQCFNALFLTTASSVNFGADVAKHVARVREAGDTENFERWSWVNYGPYHGLELPNHGINWPIRFGSASLLMNHVAAPVSVN